MDYRDNKWEDFEDGYTVSDLIILFATIIAIVIVGILLSGCRSTKETIERNDSTRVEIRYKKIFVPDTVLVPIPAQSSSVITEDSTSHLETDYAVSDAAIKDGKLHHSLANKPQKKPVEIMKEIEQKDSIVYRKERLTITKTITKKVPREYTWWDKTRFYAFYVSIAVILFAYRKKLITLARRLI
jgi:hypothetical protein